MGIYIEALILYIVLFFAGSAGAIANMPQEASDFSVYRELYRIVLYSIPSIALIWYLVLRGKKPKSAPIKPCKNDLVSGLIALGCLLLTGFTIALMPSYFGGYPASPPSGSPVAVLEWVVLCTSCFLAAYLEESYFRFYLLSKSKEMKMGQIQALIFSTALFSLCHIYEGPWGFLNSVISGAILSFLYLRYQTLHGIAIAHGLYNIAVYVINTLLIMRL